jgi:mannose-6-phosphate isomerase
MELAPGEALYLPAGILHSYLEGVGLELMASSDNVLRGGLTTKHVDVPELLRVLSFEPYEPLPVAQTRIDMAEGARVIQCSTAAADFALSLISLAPGQQFRGRGPELLLVLEGQIEAISAGFTHTMARGEHVFCSADADYFLKGEGRLARAACGAE